MSSNVNFNVELKLGAKYKARVFNKDGDIVRESGESPNLITNYGLDQWFDDDIQIVQLRVGTGSSTPLPADTQLSNDIGGTTSRSSVSFDYNVSAAPYWTRNMATFTFPLGGVVGNISEVGYTNTSSSSFNLVSKALFVDEVGNPTTITVLSDEQLQVEITLYCYFPDQDIVSTVGDYEVTIRACNVDSSNDWSPWRGFNGSTSPASDWGAYSGVISDILNIPAGTRYAPSSAARIVYTPGSFTKQIRGIWDITAGNTTLQSFAIRAGNRWQFQISPSIEKTSDDILEIYFSVSATQA